jgi:WhiB family transcriptional regulator, redox-sensing transcriptional regulator
VALQRDDHNNVASGVWQAQAACRGGVEIFFAPLSSERKEHRLSRERQAKAICRACDVRDACLAHALQFDEPHGVWGGLTEGERADLLTRADIDAYGRRRQAHLG